MVPERGGIAFAPRRPVSPAVRRARFALFLWTTAALALAAAGAPARANEAGGDADGELQYQAAPACPDRDQFMAALNIHASEMGRAPARAPAVPRSQLRVAIAVLADGGYQGSLQKRD